MTEAREFRHMLDVSSSSSTVNLSRRCAKLFFSPYCWSPKKVCVFFCNVWDHVKNEDKQNPDEKSKQFREDLNAIANSKECKLWAPHEYWTDWIPPEQYNCLVRKALNTPRPNEDEVDELVRLIRNKLNHLPKNVRLNLNWKQEPGKDIDYTTIAKYWVDKFVLLVPFLWSAYHGMIDSPNDYYPGKLLGLPTGWKRLFLRPEEFVNELYDVCLEQQDEGFVEERFTLQNGEESTTVELRTLPGDEMNLLNDVLKGDLSLKIVVSKEAIRSQRNGNVNEIVTHKIYKEISSEKCATYIFLSLDFKLKGNFYTKLLECTKVIIFTGESAIPYLASRLKTKENIQNYPFSWNDLSDRKKTCIASTGNFKFKIQSKLFRVTEILQGQEKQTDHFLTQLEGKELNEFLRNKILTVLGKFQVPKMDSVYQEREIFHEFIVDKFHLSEITTTRKIYEENVIIAETTKMVDSKYFENTGGILHRSKSDIFPKLKSIESRSRNYVIKDNFEEFERSVDEFEGCEEKLKVKVYFFFALSRDFFRSMEDYGLRRDYDRSSMEGNLSERDFLHIIKEHKFLGSRVQIVANEAGMGKTLFLISIANKLAFEKEKGIASKSAYIKNKIPLYIFMNDLVEIMQTYEAPRLTNDNIVAALTSLLCTTSFEKVFLGELLRMQTKNMSQYVPKIQLLFDGVDEVKSELRELALRTLEILHDNLPDLLIIASFRDDMAHKICNRLGAVCWKLSPVSNPEAHMASHWRSSIKAKISAGNTSSKTERAHNLQRNFLSESLQNELIPEDSVVYTVNTNFPDKSLIVIYEDLSLSVCPVLFNLSRRIEKKKHTKMLYPGEAKVFIKTVKYNIENVYKGVLTAETILVDVLTYFPDDLEYPEIKFKELILDGLDLCTDPDPDLPKFAIQLLIVIAEAFDLRAWLSLKSSSIKETATTELEKSLKFELKPISNIEKTVYVNQFWTILMKKPSRRLFKLLEGYASKILGNENGPLRQLTKAPPKCKMIAELLEESVFRLDFYPSELIENFFSKIYKLSIRRPFFQKALLGQKSDPFHDFISNCAKRQTKKFIQYLSIVHISSNIIAETLNKEEQLISEKIEKLGDYYDTVIHLGILRSQKPLEFTHKSYPEYFTAKFLWKMLRKYIFKKTSNIFTLDAMELDNNVLYDFIWCNALKIDISFFGVTLRHLGVWVFLDDFMEGRVESLVEDSQYERMQSLNSLIPRLARNFKLRVSWLDLDKNGYVCGPKNVAPLIAVEDYNLSNLYALLLQSKKYCLGIIITALATIDSVRADDIIRMLGLSRECLREIPSCSENQYGVLHWIIWGVCCAEEGLIINLDRLKEKILDYTTESGVRQKDLIEWPNSNGQTPLLFLISCMNRYRSLFDFKLHEFFVDTLGANINAVGEYGHSVLHFSSYSGPKYDPIAHNFFEEVYPNVIQFFLRKGVKNSMNVFGLTPVVNFMGSLDVERDLRKSEEDAKFALKCIKLFDYKKDFYVPDEQDNTSINNLIQGFCFRYADSATNKEIEERLDHLCNIFSSELEIHFTTVNRKGRGAIDFAFENESWTMIRLLQMKAPSLFTPAYKQRLKYLHDKVVLPKKEDKYDITDEYLENIPMIFTIIETEEDILKDIFTLFVE